jgi:hypothetical protein
MEYGQGKSQGVQESLTIRVRKGVKVNVVEDDEIAEGRDLFLDLPTHYRVAVKRVHRGGPEAEASKVGPIFLCG